MNKKINNPVAWCLTGVFSLIFITMIVAFIETEKALNKRINEQNKEILRLENKIKDFYKCKSCKGTGIQKAFLKIPNPTNEKKDEIIEITGTCLMCFGTGKTKDNK